MPPSSAVTRGWWTWWFSSTSTHAERRSETGALTCVKVTVNVTGLVAGTGVWPISGTTGPTAVTCSRRRQRDRQAVALDRQHGTGKARMQRPSAAVALALGSHDGIFP